MKAQHTPGPWNVSSFYAPKEDSDPPGVYVIQQAKESLSKLEDMSLDCIPNSGNEQEYIDARDAENAANARLIAAAPELLEALELAAKLVSTARRHFPKSIKHSDRFELELASAQISKAIHKATSQP